MDFPGTLERPERKPALSARSVFAARPILPILLVAFALRLGTGLALDVVVARTGLAPGSDGYHRVARYLVSGIGYRYAPHLDESLFLPPVYPYFLAVLFSLTRHQLLAAQIAQSAMDTATCYMLYRLARRPLGEGAGLAGASAYALYPGAWFMCARFLTEPLFVFLLVAFVTLFGIYLETRRVSTLLLTGAACCLAVMCKTVAAMLPVFMAACALLLPAFRGCRRQVLWGAGVCLAMTAVGISAWMYRNYRLTGDFVYSSSGGLALYTAYVYAAHPDQEIRASADQAAREVIELGLAHGIRVDRRNAYPRWFYDSKEEVELSRLATQVAWQRITADPAGYARHVGGNLWRFWIGAATPRSVLVAAALNVPLLFLGILGLWRSRFWRDPPLTLLVCASLYLFFGHVMILAVVRYSLTVMPMVCLFGGYAVWSIANRSRPSVSAGSVH